MAKEDVNIKVSANVAEAIQMWKAMEAGPEGMAKKLDSMGQRGKSATKGMVDELAGMVGKWTSVTAVIGLAIKAVNDLASAQARLREEQLGATNSLDDQMNFFQIQANIGQKQAPRFRQQIMSTAAQRSVSSDTAFATATQLVSSGASAENVVFGGVLNEVLQLYSATGVSTGKAGDPKQITKSFVQWMRSQGLDPNNAKQAREEAMSIQRLYGETNLQLEELTMLAPAASTIRKFAGTDSKETLAIVSQFLDLTNIERSSTSFQTGVTRLATSGANSQVKRGLKLLGLKPDDVDFQGESFQQVIGNLTDKFQGVGGAKANQAAKLIFGMEGLPFYNTVTQPGALEEMRRRGGLMSNEAAYIESRDIAESGRGAEARQAGILAAEAGFRNNILDPAVIRGRLQGLMENRHVSQMDQALINAEFDDPWGPNDWYTPEMRLEKAATNVGAAGRRDKGKLPTDYFEENRQMLRGDIEIRIKTSDGLDLPSQVDAIDLQDKK